MNGLDQREGESGRGGGVCVEGLERSARCDTGSLVSGSVGEESSEKIFILNICKKRHFF